MEQSLNGTILFKRNKNQSKRIKVRKGDLDYFKNLQPSMYIQRVTVFHKNQNMYELCEPFPYHVY